MSMNLNRRNSMKQLPNGQRGLSLLEGLISILIFSFGLLGLVGLQAASLRNSADAKYRADATFLANQIVGQMWADRANIASYATGAPAGSAACTAGTASGNANVTAWLDRIDESDGDGFLPGAAANLQQIAIQGNVVTVIVCWQAPQDASAHNVRLTSSLDFNP
jgi:type IV pilus assembly protein PilV